MRKAALRMPRCAHEQRDATFDLTCGPDVRDLTRQRRHTQLCAAGHRAAITPRSALAVLRRTRDPSWHVQCNRSGGARTRPREDAMVAMDSRNNVEGAEQRID